MQKSLSKSQLIYFGCLILNLKLGEKLDFFLQFSKITIYHEFLIRFKIKFIFI
jgi:hypothetical protein